MCLCTKARIVAIVFARSSGSEAMYCAGVLTPGAGFMDLSHSRWRHCDLSLSKDMRNGISAIGVALAVFVTGEAISAGASESTHGPLRGSLVLQGGVGLNQAIASRFVALAGGPSSHIVLIPTASVGDAGPPGMETWLARRMRDSWGVDAVTVLHSLDRDTSNSDRFVEPLRRATGVWMLGGFPEHLVHSYLGTKTERSIRELLDRGGV